jgi:hypothetical protein
MQRRLALNKSGAHEYFCRMFPKMNGWCHFGTIFIIGNTMSKQKLLLAALAMGAFSAQATELKIIGSIIPGTCDIVISNNGVVDFESTSKTQVMAMPPYNGTYVPPTKSVPFTLTCGGPTPLAITVSDNKATTLAPIGDGSDQLRYGLGLSGTDKIGSYSIFHSDFLITATTGGAPAAPAGQLVRPVASGSTGPWTVPDAGEAGAFNPLNALGFKTSPADVVPAPLVSLQGNLVIQPFYNQHTIQTTNTEIRLDGSATITVVYL